MSSRYGDRGFERYEDADEERYGGREYEGRAPDYGRGRQRPDYGTTARGQSAGGDYGRDYGYGREYGERDFDSGASREGILGGYAGTPLSRRQEYEDYGREYERGPSREYERRPARGYTREYGREPDYARGYGPETARERAGERTGEYDGVRSYDTDYGRTTSRFYGRSGYEYGRDDYDPRVGERGEYGGAGYGGRRDERGNERGERGWWDRTADQLLSWFGDEDAERRRRLDQLREGRGYGQGKFRGRGPKNYRRSDERIAEEVGDRMTENDWLDASDIDVAVNNGEVTLGGSVDSRYAKRLAEDIAESVSGVTNVQNNLRVRGQEAGRVDPGLEAAVAAGQPIPAPGASDVTLTSDAPDSPDAGATGKASKAAGRG